MKGDGLGPKCIFSFDTLDIENVFINSAHAYEVFLENKGDIEAAYSLTPSASLFGPNFTFAPSNGMLQPGKLQAIQVSYTSPRVGGITASHPGELAVGILAPGWEVYPGELAAC